MTSRPERPSLPAQKVGAPNSSPSAGQIVGERRAREIQDDPRRLFFELMHVLTIILPNTEVLDEFVEKVRVLERDIPMTTKTLMLEILLKRLEDVRLLERKLEELLAILRGVEK
jgi:hypothetical protein